MFSKFFFESEAIYEIMWKSMVQPDRLQMADNTVHVFCMLDN
jgi:hypothetical protein